MKSGEIIQKKAEELAQGKYGKDYNELIKEQQLGLWIEAHDLYVDRMFGHWLRKDRVRPGISNCLYVG